MNIIKGDDTNLVFNQVRAIAHSYPKLHKWPNWPPSVDAAITDHIQRSPIGWLGQATSDGRDSLQKHYTCLDENLPILCELWVPPRFNISISTTLVNPLVEARAHTLEKVHNDLTLELNIASEETRYK